MIIIDVEASGLAEQSYPIEIAWQDTENVNQFDSFLIQPLDSWSYWDDHAEQVIHHISRAELFQKGISPAAACDRLNQHLRGKTVYSDAVSYDQRWVTSLFEAVGMRMELSFGSIYDRLPAGCREKYSTLIENEPVKHRALEDARQIATWVCWLI